MAQSYNAVSHLDPDDSRDEDDGVRELSPLVWLDDPNEMHDDTMFDFRPIDREGLDEIVAPKDSSAQESADSSEPEEPATPVTPVPAEKVSGEPKVSEPSTPTSSDATPSSPGKTAPPVVK